MRKQIFSLALLLIVVLVPTRQLDWHVNPVNSRIQDQFGRLRVSHGINAVYKQKPFLPRRSQYNFNDSLVEQDFKNLQEWGFNSIRLFIAWEGFEPKEGQYNYTYLEQLRKIIGEAKQYNINILLDAHQDLFSRKFCGQGFPTWLGKVETFPSPVKVDLQFDQEGFPTKESCMKQPFFKYYLSEDVMKFSHDFFTNKDGMLDKFISMWQRVVMFFLPQDNILGYDIINQPSGASLYRGPYEYIGPGMNNNKFLLPFYKKVSKAIRKIDKSKLLYFEPSPADIIGGFYDSPSQQPYKRLDIMSYHTYCPLTQSYGSKKCSLINQQYTTNRHSNAKKLKIGLSMTEFGSVADQANDLTQIKNVLNVTQTQLTSWYYWQFKYNADSTSSTHPPQLQSFYYPDGRLQHQKVKTLGHPYAYAICGQGIKQFWDEGLYQLSLTPRQCGNQKKTQIFINQPMHFGKGFQVQFEPKCAQCYLKAINGTSKSYYEVLLSKQAMKKPITLRLIGGIREEK